MSKPYALRAIERLALIVVGLTAAVICGRYLLGRSFWEYDATALAQWLLITVSLAYGFRYFQLRRDWMKAVAEWENLNNIQRRTAYTAQLSPERVFPAEGHTTIRDIANGEVLVTNDPAVRNAHPALFRREPWRFVNYPRQNVA